MTSRALTTATLPFTLLGLLIGASAYAQQGQAPDTVFYNGKIITVDPLFTIGQAFAIRGDQYLAVGDNARIRALAGKNTRMVDLRGASVIPGLSDNHDHLYNSEKVMRGIDLIGATSTEEVLKRLRTGLDKAKPGETVFGSVGWRAPLTRKDLDRLSTTVPIVALRGRRGAATLNSAALQKAGIAEDTQSYLGVPVPRDGKGELTGALPDWPAGYYAMDKVVPPPTLEEEDSMIARGQKERNALGITSIRDLSNWPPGMRAFVRTWQRGALTLRVSMGLETPDRSDPASLLRQQIVTPGFGDHWLRIDSSGEEPWPPDFPQEKYLSLILEVNRLGWRPAVHVPTNESLEGVLQAYEAADRESPIRDKRWVVEHIAGATPPLMDRLAKLGVIVSVTTNYSGYASDYDAAVRTMGKEQAERQTPLREMLDHHLVVVTGSDYTGPNPDTQTPNNPFIPLYYYVSRKTRDGRVLGPQEKISRQEALRLATNNNAFATWEEKVKGSIEPRKLADFVILSGDFMTVPEEQILKLHPLATYVGGRKVYSAPDANGL
ncbi:MAG: amidohydrolase [Acidobacteriota bacterium]|nr:amidohydrolase [Acidobacteriota bacterium]